MIQIGVLGLISSTFYRCEAFTCADPKSAKNTVKLSVFFALSGSGRAKAARKNVDEIDTRKGCEKGL